MEEITTPAGTEPATNQEPTVPVTEPTTPPEQTPAAGNEPAPKPASARSLFSPNADNATTSWVDALPEELRGNAELRKFKDVNEALKGYTHLVSMAGRKGLAAPAADAGEDAWNAYFTARRGGIESAEGYSTKFDAEALVGLDQEVYDVASQFMFMNGFSDSEHARTLELLGAIRDREAKIWEQENVRRCADAVRDLKHEWGEKYERNMNSIRNFIADFPEARNALQQYGLENNAAMCKMILCAAERTSESTNPVPVKPEMGMTAAELKKRIDSVVKSEAYNDRTSKGHADAHKQFMDLMREKAKMRQAGLL